MFTNLRKCLLFVLIFSYTLSFLDNAVSKAGLIHHYEFTTDARDSVGNRDGQFFNGARAEGGALVLDGINDYVQYSSFIVPTSGSYTVALFAQADVIPARYFELISQGYSAGPGFYLGLHQNGSIRVTDAWWPNVMYPSDAQRHHFAVTVDAVLGVSKLYIDGVLGASVNFAISTTTIGTPTRLGNQFDGITGNEAFPGVIDDVRIYDHALSSGEVADLNRTVPEPTSFLIVSPFALYLFAVHRRKRIL